LADEPTARNSNLFPVKAKGEVRFLSVLSSKISGIRPMFNLSEVFSSGVILRSPTFSSKRSSIRFTSVPRKEEIIAGGASLAPNLCELLAETIEARNKS